MGINSSLGTVDFGKILTCPCALHFSAELQKSIPGQPTITDVVQAVLKECRKENLKYKMVALRCAAEVLQATKEDRFQELADIIFPMIKKVTTS